jgi:EF hand
MQKGRQSGSKMEKKMFAPAKTALAAAALIGAAFTSATLAETGPNGHSERGAFLMQEFDAIDTDKDGNLSQAELAAHRAAQFAAADTNGDGMLGPEELTAWHEARMTAMLQERSARMIWRMDDNGDGSLSAEEMGEGPVEERFARIDTDDDGMISKAEAEAAGERFAEHRKRRGHGMMGEGLN